MSTQNHSPKVEDLTLEVAQALLAEAAEQPWLASMLLQRKDWLIELAGRLRSLSRRMRQSLRRALASGMAIAVLLASFMWTTPVLAGTIIVDGTICTLADAIVTANGPTDSGGCTGGTSGSGSAGADTIDLQTDVTLTSALPSIISQVTILGNGHTIDGDGLYQVLAIEAPNGNLTLNQITIDNGYSAIDGGGIYNTGTLTVQSSTISNNSTKTVGGGIFNDGILTVDESTISGNSASGNLSGAGGGIFSNDNLTVRNSTITNNSGDFAGGIFSNGDGYIQTSTISGNESYYNGGGIDNVGSLTIQNSTITNNVSDVGEGSGIFNYGDVHVQNSIVALQSAGDDCYNGPGSLISDDYNIESTTSCGFLNTNDQQNVTSGNLNLGTLVDNGGPTQTHALLSGSVAIETIPNGTNGCVAGTSVDQRGAVRADGAGRGGSACDIGAYEYDSTETPTAVTMSELSAKTVSPPAVWAAIGAGLTALAASWAAFWHRKQQL